VAAGEAISGDQRSIPHDQITLLLRTFADYADSVGAHIVRFSIAAILHVCTRPRSRSVIHADRLFVVAPNRYDRPLRHARLNGPTFHDFRRSLLGILEVAGRYNGRSNSPWTAVGPWISGESESAGCVVVARGARRLTVSIELIEAVGARSGYRAGLRLDRSPTSQGGNRK
jgi:hypothetical protein